MKTTLPSGLAQSSAFALAALITVGTVLAQVPRIDFFTPVSGHIGDPILISGANFASSPADNIVHFGAVRAMVTAASADSLIAIVPPGATYTPVTVTAGGLTAYANAPFAVRFASSGIIDSSSFAAHVDLPAEPGETPAVAIADLDGDGKPDLIAANRLSRSISVFRHIAPAGSLAETSFAAKVDFSTPTEFNGSELDGPSRLAIADVDGDGKLDIVAAEPAYGTVFVFRNTSLGGSIDMSCFASPVAFVSGCGGGSIAIAIRDLDADGKPDIAAVDFCTGTLNVLQNSSTPGSINANSFTAPISFPASGSASAFSSVAVGDLDGDGMADVAVGRANANVVSVLRNISTGGDIAFEAPVTLSAPRPTSLALGDLNGDGKLDIAAGRSGLVTPLQNNSSTGGFAASSFPRTTVFGGHDFSALALGDFDGDGRADVVGAGTLSIGQNLTPAGADIASDTFLYSTDVSPPESAEAVAVGDLDGDGRPDLVAGYVNGGFISVFRNSVAECSPPSRVLRASSLAGHQICLDFDGLVEVSSAQNPGNYLVNNGAVSVTEAVLLENGKSVLLTVSGLSSVQNTPFTVTASGILNTCTEPTFGSGTVSGVVVPPVVEFLHSFRGTDDGAIPICGIIRGLDGALYGTTLFGPQLADGNGGFGTVFKINADGTSYRILTSFAEAAKYPTARLCQSADGTLFGRCGFDVAPAIFRVNADGGGFREIRIDSVNHNIIEANGIVYGSAATGSDATGGANHVGAIFSLDHDLTSATILHDFGPEIGDPNLFHGTGATLLRTSDGLIYGATTITLDLSGADRGTVFKLNADGTIEVLKHFLESNSDGLPFYPLIEGLDGAFYGTLNHLSYTFFGPSFPGSLFRLTRSGDYTVLKRFSYCEGGEPSVGLAQGRDGKLYGRTEWGGTSGFGTIFKLNADGSGFRVLAEFDFPNVYDRPFNNHLPDLGALVVGPDDALYGTTQRGGEFDNGAVFRVPLPMPRVTQLEPNSTLANGPAFLLTVNGDRFEPNSTVFWNGEPRQTSFVSDHQLQAAITRADIASSTDIATAVITVVNDGDFNSNPLLFTIVRPITGQVLSALGPARVWIGLKNSDDVGTKFDLLTEVFKNGSLIGSGQLDSVPGGSSGFNNAVSRAVNTSLPANAVFLTGDTLSFRLSVRIAVNVSGHSSGTARLWFNDSAADSRFSATLDGTATQFFLLNNSVLGASAGPGAKKTIDVLVNKNVGGNPFKPFGTWTKTF